MSIHCRLAEAEVHRILKKNGNRKIIMHWYSGNERWMEKFIEFGCFFSINSNMIGSNNGKQIINQIPINKIFVESDGSFTQVLGRKYTIEKLSTVYDELVYAKGIGGIEILKNQVAQKYLSLLKQ